ncbi:MAG: SRPBCC family protein [Deltaproteobacteria bacterium]|nr:SRPBCC family protein [Deltaproteobacteria bacterium]
MLRKPLVLLCAAALMSVGVAHAQPALSSVIDAPLGLLNPEERRLLSPQLDVGPVLLVDLNPAELPAIVLAARVHASPAQVAQVLTHPEGYPRFMPALDRVHVESRRGAQLAYEWSWRLAVFTLRGRNVMTTLPGSARRGYRIDVRATGGDLGVGRMTWRIHPDPAGSFVIFSSRLDMRDANWVSGRLERGGRSVNRTINIALATVMLMGTQREAERLAGYERPAAASHASPMAVADIDLDALTPLLARGDLAFFHMRGELLDDVTVAGRMLTTVDPVRRVMEDPVAFSRSLVNGAHAEILEESAEGSLFSWGISLPLVGVTGRMRLSRDDGAVLIEGVSGALAHGRWRFDTHRFPSGEACVYGVGRFDPRETSALVRTLIGDDAYFAHGLTAAMQIMVVRSIRIRALRRVAEQRAASQ